MTCASRVAGAVLSSRRELTRWLTKGAPRWAAQPLRGFDDLIPSGARVFDRRGRACFRGRYGLQVGYHARGWFNGDEPAVERSGIRLQVLPPTVPDAHLGARRLGCVP